MTALTRKRAERQRRKDAGEVRVEVWLDQFRAKDLEEIMKSQGHTREDAVSFALYHYRLSIT